MNVDKSKIGLTFPHDKYPREWQWQLMQDAGAQHRIDVAKDKAMCAHWQEAMRIVRERDIVHFPALSFVPAKARGLPRQTTQLVTFTAALAARKAIGIEAYTGRRTNNPQQLDAMLRDATAVVRGGSRKLPKGFATLGRKPTNFSEDDWAKAARVWADTRLYPSWELAGLHLPEGFSTRRAWLKWGDRETWAKKWKRRNG